MATSSFSAIRKGEVWATLPMVLVGLLPLLLLRWRINVLSLGDEEAKALGVEAGRLRLVVIAAAAVPGKKAPVLVTADMLGGMRPGSLVVDLAAEQGGNCEASRPGEETLVGTVRVVAPLNLAATIPHHASQLYAKNLANFVLNMTKSGELQTGSDDEIVQESLLTRGGEVAAARVREALGMPPLPAAVPA